MIWHIAAAVLLSAGVAYWLGWRDGARSGWTRGVATGWARGHRFAARTVVDYIDEMSERGER